MVSFDLRSRELARGLSIYGCILGPVTLLTLSPPLESRRQRIWHFIFGQAGWFVVAGAFLCDARIKLLMLGM